MADAAKRTTATAPFTDRRIYEITDFGVIHEIARGGSYGNLSMAVHIYDLGAWNFR